MPAPTNSLRSIPLRVVRGLKVKKAPKPQDCFDLRLLPEELLLQILGHVDISDITRVMVTSKRMLSLCTPFLYRFVDLRRHLIWDNSSEYQGGWHIDDMLVTVAHPGFHMSRMKDVRFRARQEGFLQSILAEPELGEYIKNLEWTIQHFNVKSVLTGRTQKIKILEFMNRVRYAHLEIDQVIDEPRKFKSHKIRFQAHRGLPEKLFPEAQIFRITDPGNSWVSAMALLAVLGAKMADFVIQWLQLERIHGQHQYGGRAWTARSICAILRPVRDSKARRTNNMREMYEALYERVPHHLEDVYQRLAWPMYDVVQEVERRGLHIPSPETRYMCVELDMKNPDAVQLRCVELSIPDL